MNDLAGFDNIYLRSGISVGEMKMGWDGSFLRKVD